jgi:hypothetical protein
MEKLILIQGYLWIVVVILFIAIVWYIAHLFISKSKPTEVNANVNLPVAKQALEEIMSGELTPEEQAAALQTYFNTASDPNPQGFFARLWSVL